jgi:uncharacterized RDD family membrane protein YckC
MHCSKCGATLTSTSGFCGKCGAPIVGYSVGQTVAPTSTAPSTTPSYPTAGPGYAAPAYTAPVGVQAAVHPYAGFWLRFAAWLIDVILLSVVSNIIVLIFGMSTMNWQHILASNGSPTPEDLAPALGMIFRIMLISTVINWLYYAFLESSTWQGTLGKKALGLFVTDLHGNRISFGRASGRFFARIITSFTIGIGYVMIAFTEKKQALHDMIAGCLVFRRQ